MMNRREFIKNCSLGLISVPLLNISCKSFSSGSQPNILFILSDDAGYDDFGFHGGTDIPTPNLDRLAANGIVFTDAHVTATVCSPSRAGMLTGRYQQRFGHEANSPGHSQGMDPAEVTLADALKKLNYRTGLFGKWHLGMSDEYHPNNRGFDEFYGLLGGSRSYFPSENQDKSGRPQAMMHNDQYVRFEGYLTDVLTEKAIAFMEADDDRPFFTFVSYTAVHTPMEARKEYLEMFKDHPRPVLAAMTHAMDEGVGRIMGSLEKSGRLNDTLIIFTNDNGGSAFNTSSNDPLKGWKGNKFEGGSRVPFLVHWKDHLAGRRTFQGITSTLDIFATAFTCAGGKNHGGNHLDGVNLIPYLKGESQGNPHDWLFWRKEEEAAVRWKEWKLIRLQDYGYVLYNLEENLGETENLVNQYSEISNKMKQALENWESELVEPAWHESQDWRDVTWQIHKDLMENRKPEKIHP